ncbi:hypothetical protein THOM_1644 [Trachipleistophora hominis]|uniref:Uncharacterized protein n=1 Tax=Trachipleistophora hominis TaxID=72359 RepID=L7JXC6_TRAHO|nr:hypothetical protein THOM_1644 [Trachipleistophora hominis]
MDKIIEAQKLNGKSLHAIEPHLQKITAEKSQKLAIWLADCSYDEVDANSMLRFIKTYMRSAHPVFIVEIYQYLQKKDKTLLREYVERFKQMDTCDKGTDRKIKRVEKKKMVDKTDKRIKREAIKRANKCVRQQRDERIETKEKLKIFTAMCRNINKACSITFNSILLRSSCAKAIKK